MWLFFACFQLQFFSRQTKLICLNSFKKNLDDCTDLCESLRQLHPYWIGGLTIGLLLA